MMSDICVRLACIKSMTIKIPSVSMSVVLSIFLFPFTIVACDGSQAKGSRTSKGGDDLLLGLVGYNYTDRHISSYTVDSAGGGHINMSSPSSGGSGVTCCARVSKNYRGPLRVRIRWQVDGCRYIVKSPRTGETQELRHYYYKESNVDVERIQGDDPAYLETHFYPNGVIRVRLTSTISDPQLTLDESRVDQSTFPRCENDEKPQW